SEYRFIDFYEKEMHIRRSFLYPPYVFLALITVSHENEIMVYEVIQKIGQLLAQKLDSCSTILGPSPSPIARIKNRYRYQIIINYRNDPKLQLIIQDILNTFKKERKQDVQIIVDMN